MRLQHRIDSVLICRMINPTNTIYLVPLTSLGTIAQMAKNVVRFLETNASHLHPLQDNQTDFLLISQNNYNRIDLEYQMQKFSSTQKDDQNGRGSNQGANRKKFSTFIDEDSTLCMEIFDEEVSECYDLLIDDRYMKNRDGLSNFFTNTVDMHYTLVELKDQITLTEDYNVILNLNLSASKIKLTKQFVFQLGLNVDKTLLQQRQKIQILIEQVSTLHGERDLQRQKNRQKEDSFFQEISELKQQRTKLKYRLQQASQQIEKLNLLLVQKENESQQLKRNLLQRKEEISSYESSENNSRSRVIELQQTIKMLQLNKMKKDLLLNQSNSHYYLFHYLYTELGTIRIKKIGQNGWANFISNALLPQNEPTIFQMKINHTKDGSIAMGVCNNLIFGSSDIDSPMSITYFVHDGRIFQKGTRRSSGPPILLGQILKLQIDWKANCIEWYNGETSVGKVQLNSNFKLNNLFFIVRMFWKQDQIELK